MMTIKETLEDTLMQLGMFSKDAKKVVELTSPKMTHDHRGRLLDLEKAELEISSTTLQSLLNLVKLTAKLWLDKNVPTAWYRPLFD